MGMFRKAKTQPAPDDRSQLHKDADKALAESLAPEERVLSIVLGQMHAALIATDRRAIIYKKGFLGGAGFGRKVALWEYRNLTGAQLETGPITGRLSLQGPGLSDQIRGAGWSDSHVLTIERKDYDRAKATVAIIREQMTQAQRGLSGPQPPNAPDHMEQLTKLGGLRDAGIITEEEFQAKKAELLTRI